MTLHLPLGKRAGGYKKPYRATLLLRDILIELGTTHLQEVYTAFRKHLKAITPRRVRRFHLPSRDTLRMYVYYARRLGLIVYTGEEGVAHRKDGSEAPDLANRRYFRIVMVDDPRWSLPIDSRTGVGWKGLSEGIEAVPSEREVAPPEIPTLLIRPRKKVVPPKRRMPRRVTERIDVSEEMAPIRARIKELLPLVDRLPGSLSELDRGLMGLVEPVAALVRKAPEDLEVSRTFDAIGTALELLSPALAGREMMPAEIDEVRRALAM